MNIEQLSGLVCGITALVVGLKAILTQGIAVDLDDADEPNLWLYGWRAVAIGYLFVLVSFLGFAIAAGVMPASWGWSSKGG